MPESVLTQQADLTPDALINRLRRQLDADCELGLVERCSEETLDRVVTQIVMSLWEASRVKTYLPILALRKAREEIRAVATVA